MRISTNQIQLSMLDNLQHGFGEYARLDRQISTQKRILQPSDDPVGSVQLLGLQKEQVAMAQYQKNIANAKSQLSQGELQFETMTNMLMRLRELTQTAATGSLSDADRKAVASEVAIIKDGLLDLANARNESGSSLFTGSKVDQTALVKQASGDYSYQGDNLVREVSIANGVTVGLNQTAATGSLSDADRKAVASEVAIIKDGLLDLANARNESGSSLFTGSKVDQTALVKVTDPKAADFGSYKYNGDGLIRDVSIANG
ncbi:MAG: flagellar hook-associated protein FlgL, partial [Aeromonas veronii]